MPPWFPYDVVFDLLKLNGYYVFVLGVETRGLKLKLVDTPVLGKVEFYLFN